MLQSIDFFLQNQPRKVYLILYPEISVFTVSMVPSINRQPEKDKGCVLKRSRWKLHALKKIFVAIPVWKLSLNFATQQDAIKEFINRQESEEWVKNLSMSFGKPTIRCPCYIKLQTKLKVYGKMVSFAPYMHETQVCHSRLIL